MKNRAKLYLMLIVLPILFISCSREEPFVAPIVVAPTVIKMNEIYSTGVPTDPDWIEIYNAGTTSANIGGYLIYDSGGQGGTKPKMAIPAGTTLAAGAYYVVVTDISTTIDPSGFGLSSGGEGVWLEDKTGSVIDNVTFPALASGQSYSRIPNGSATWAVTSTATKGASNK